MSHIAPFVLRAWDCVVASAPLLAAFLIGAIIWKALEARLSFIPKDSLAGIFLSGGAVVQAATWLGALFSSLLGSIIQFATLTLGCLALGLLLRSPKRLRDKYPVLGGAVARFSGFLALVMGFVLGGSSIPDFIPSDAVAYHIPISSWFARGGSWSILPNHLWPAQWPIASSLWSSFCMVDWLVADRLVAWSAQNQAFIVWTAVIVFTAIRSFLPADGRGNWMAWLISASLLLGGYSAFQRFGFVDYRAGFFAAALMATLVQLPVTAWTVPLAVALASTVAEFRPQGLLFAMTLLVCWPGVAPRAPASERGPAPVNRRVILGGALLLLAGLLFVKWWLLVWTRWGSPAPPLFARRWNLSATQKYADDLFSYLWTADFRRGLRFVLLGDRRTLLVPFISWALVLLAFASARSVIARQTGGDGRGLGVWRRLSPSVAALCPVAASAFLAWHVPSEASRMIPPILPACCIVSFALLSRTGSGKLTISLFSILFCAASLPGLPPPWDRPHAGRAYPTGATIYFSQVEEQLERLRNRRPLIFDQYIAFLPPGYKQMGVTYGPWASLPNKPLRTIDSWMTWLRENGVDMLVAEKGKDLKSTWEWTQERKETPDFSVLDRWFENCPGRVNFGQWITCPVLPVPPGR